jgi:hypothetical protein
MQQFRVADEVWPLRLAHPDLVAGAHEDGRRGEVRHEVLDAAAGPLQVLGHGGEGGTSLVQAGEWTGTAPSGPCYCGHSARLLAVCD